MTVGGFLARFRRGLAAQDPHEFLVDDLHDLLARVQGLGDLGAEGAFLDGRGKGTNHGNGNVRVEQCTPDFPHCGIDVGFAQTPLATQVLERGSQPVRQ